MGRIKRRLQDCCLCVCLRPTAYKRLVRGLYPPNTTGFEVDLTPQNVGRLTNFALREPEQLPQIGRFFEKLASA